MAEVKKENLELELSRQRETEQVQHEAESQLREEIHELEEQI